MISTNSLYTLDRVTFNMSHMRAYLQYLWMQKINLFAHVFGLLLIDRGKISYDYNLFQFFSIFLNKTACVKKIKAVAGCKEIFKGKKARLK